MFSDWENYYGDEETMHALKRYREMLGRQNGVFFDLFEYERIIDYFIDQFNYKDAIKAISLALKQHSNASSIKLKFIQLLIETGKPAKALRIAKTLNGFENTNYELPLAKGIALNQTGKYFEARSEFETAIRLCDENKDEVAYDIAQSFIQIGMVSRAIKYLLLAYKYNKDNLLVLYDLAVNYEKLNSPEEGIYYYRKYLDIDPFAEHVWNNLGLLYTFVEAFEKACESYDFAIAINPQFYSAQFNKADMLIAKDDYSGAIQVYSELLSWDCTNTKALCDLGNCYDVMGDYYEALQTYLRTIEISKDCADAWFGAGMVYFQLKRYKLCIASFKRAVSIQPSNSDYWFMLGEAYTCSRKLNLAIDAYTIASELNPLDYEVWMAFAQLLYKKRRIPEAIDKLKQLYLYNYDNPTLNYRLAAYYAYCNDIENAMQYFERGLMLNFKEHYEILRRYPKIKIYPEFQHMIEQLIQHDVPL